MLALRLSRIALVAAVACFFTLVAFGNVTDDGANWRFVTHVMSMDTTFQDPDLMWRAVTEPALQRAAYGDAFAAARGPAIVGLTLGLLLYAMGFLVVAGEWFAMWQSHSWNGQATAGIFVLFIGLALLHLCGPEREPRAGPGRGG